MEEKNKLKARLGITIYTTIIFILLIVIASMYFYIKNIKESNNIEISTTSITIDEAYEKVEELYSKAEKIFFELEYKYSEYSEEIKITNNDKEVKIYANEILNYDEIIDSVFTENGKKQYEENNGLAYMNNKVYGNMIGYTTDVFYVTTEFIKLSVSDDTITCVAKKIYYDDEKVRTNEEDFVLKKINNSWLIDEYTHFE